MRLYFCHSKELDYQKGLYEPLRQSSLNEQHTLIFPHEEPISTIKSKDIIKTCDLVFAEVSFPATGMGIELGWTDAFEVPIICLHQPESKPSRSLQFISTRFIEYTTPQDLIKKITAFLKEYNQASF